ncbi:MAG: S-layer homology domain-containing protein [Smithella sp.]|nr:S-layer homology domain-containing protein [Smithella sp.]
MMMKLRIRTFVFVTVFCVAALLIISCGSKERLAVNQLDTPEHHTFTGLKLLDQEKYSDASRAFRMAIQLNKNYSRAYSGMALVNIYTGKYKIAWENLDLAFKNANDSSEKLFVNVSKIRYYCANDSDPRWLDLAKEQFNEAVAIDSEHSPAYYHMGFAYKQALEFNQAGQMFATVLQLKKTHIYDANYQLIFLQQVQSAHPQTRAGKKIALAERLTRAQAASLFVNELKMKAIYAPMGSVVSDAGMQTETNLPESTAIEDSSGILPESKVAAEASSPAAASVPVKIFAKDIANHPLKNDIEIILEIGIRGLGNDPNGNFNPEEVLSRGEFASMLEDIMLKLNGVNNKTDRGISLKLMFPDVSPEMPYYNSIISVASQRIMKAKNLKTGEFYPLKPLSGAEALLIIRQLKNKFKIID